jgi:hypothetical protein
MTPLQKVKHPCKRYADAACAGLHGINGFLWRPFLFSLVQEKVVIGNPEQCGRLPDREAEDFRGTQPDGA